MSDFEEMRNKKPKKKTLTSFNTHTDTHTYLSTTDSGLSTHDSVIHDGVQFYKPLGPYLIDLSLVTDILEYLAGITIWGLNILRTVTSCLLKYQNLRRVKTHSFLLKMQVINKHFAVFQILKPNLEFTLTDCFCIIKMETSIFLTYSHSHLIFVTWTYWSVAYQWTARWYTPQFHACS